MLLVPGTKNLLEMHTWIPINQTKYFIELVFLARCYWREQQAYLYLAQIKHRILSLLERLIWVQPVRMWQMGIDVCQKVNISFFIVSMVI